MDAQIPSGGAPAARDIQPAVDACMAGGLILVTNGTCYPDAEIVVDKPLTVRSVNGRDVTIVDGGRAHRCFRLGSNAVLDGFTLRNGLAYRGAGAYLTNNAAVLNCIIAGNATPTDEEDTARGGGLYLDGSGQVSNCIIRQNFAYNGGGGIFLMEGGWVVDSTIHGNTAGGGGGVYCAGGGLVCSSFISSNSASEGGGAWCDGGGILSNCAVQGNTATGQGGGLVGYQGFEVNRCALRDNSAGTRGGGLSAGSGGIVRNTLICGNRVTAPTRPTRPTRQPLSGSRPLWSGYLSSYRFTSNTDSKPAPFA